jgi:hypothetical protein
MKVVRNSEFGVMWKDSDLCSIYSLIDSRPEHRLSELRLSLVFLLGASPGYCLQLGHDRFFTEY